MSAIFKAAPTASTLAGVTDAGRGFLAFATPVASRIPVVDASGTVNSSDPADVGAFIGAGSGFTGQLTPPTDITVTNGVITSGA